ncbi:hypothetical protein REO35_15495 [Clostridium perfringens]|nr:hypothetical protein [Clostridium perfringens]MDT7989098.1 hypothetical protein [Clostridium perfringens]
MRRNLFLENWILHVIAKDLNCKYFLVITESKDGMLSAPHP